MFILSYNNSSASARLLRDALGCKLVSHEGNKNLAKGGHLLLHWGKAPILFSRRLDVGSRLNRDVSLATNKLLSYQAFSDHALPHPEWTTDASQVALWPQGTDVFARLTLTGHSGRGIVPFIVGEQPIPTDGVRVYTKYVKKSQEYRVHVFNGEVIATQRKARKLSVPDEQVNWQVRNLEGGFIYADHSGQLPEEASLLAVDAVRACNLDFGAVDIIYNERRNIYYVLEVNTSPGLVGRTLQAYVEAITKYKQENSLL